MENVFFLHLPSLRSVQISSFFFQKKKSSHRPRAGGSHATDRQTDRPRIRPRTHVVAFPVRSHSHPRRDAQASHTTPPSLTHCWPGSGLWLVGFPLPPLSRPPPNPTLPSHAVTPAAAAAAGECAGLPGRALRVPRRPRGRARARGAPAPRVRRARRLAPPRRGAPRCRGRVLARALRRGPRRPPPRPVTRFVRTFAPLNSSEP